MNNPFLGRSLLKLADFTANEIQSLLDLSARLKQAKKSDQEIKYLQDKNILLIFEKTSTRTRVSFEVAARDQGAGVTYLAQDVSQIGHKESIEDSARVLGRVYDGIQYRGFSQALVETLAKYAGVPVYNGLTDDYHPTQGLADLLTMQEHSSKPLAQTAFTFVGDCRFNMANTLLLSAAIMGMDVRLLCPSSLQPTKAIVEQAQAFAKVSGAKIYIGDDFAQALNGADFVHTDVWVSMGEAKEVWAERIDLLKDYQVNNKLMAQTNNPNAKFMHCLPAFHNRKTAVGEAIYQQFGLDGIEVSDEVFESANSIVFDQAENRLHTIKAVMVATISDKVSI